MRLSRTRGLAGLAGLFALILAVPAPAAEFPLKDGDTWVMAGDSITAQHLHSNDFEAYCFARYPKRTFRFRNSGVGGDTVPKVLARFDWDVASWKPTVVSVELGMNDQGGFPVEKFIANMGELDAKIRSVGARPVYFTPSPVNNGDTSDKIGGNARLDAYSVALKGFAAEKDAPFADQFHAVLDPWGRNKPMENLARTLPELKRVAKDDKVEGVSHLRDFLEAQEKAANHPVSMEGDPVHPGPPGQLMMAAALVKALGAEEYVSLAALDSAGKVVKAENCAVDAVAAKEGTLAFDRLDESIPFPIPDDARAVLSVDDTPRHLSQFLISVEGLTASKYLLKVDGKEVGTFHATTLRVGVNLTGEARGPLADQGRAVLAAIHHKEGLVGQFRNQARAASQADAKEADRDKLEQFRKNVEDADAKIREAAEPRKHRYELSPAE